MTSMPKTLYPVRWLDNTLLCIVLGLTVLRTTIIEAPLVEQFQTRLMISSEVVSLLISTILLACLGLWLFAAVVSGRLRWRKTGFGVAACVFILAGVLSAVFASDKRSAVTDLVTLITPVLTGLLLVQLLTSSAKIRLALLLILSVGVAATVQCFDQHAESNEIMVADYEADPDKHLEKMGIEPDSMQHWMYEHRLYSKDIRGFLMTSNSAASFFLFAIFAGLGLCLQSFGRKMTQEKMAACVCYLLALGVVLFGLFLTQSKGGIGAFMLGALLLVVLLVFRRAKWKYRRILGVLVLLLIVVAGGVVIHYGAQHGRLPGGSSMLVRWQYWVSAAEMIREHPVTGVGGGNFSTLYTHYKIPAASETIQNPHNWILSLLSQYGPLGLIAFLAAVSVPLYRTWAFHNTTATVPDSETPSPRGNLWIGVLAFAAFALLFIRPLLVDSELLQQKASVWAAAYLVLYLLPAGVTIITFVLLYVASSGDGQVDNRNDRLTIAIICGLVAVLFHNLIDFAIFEPGNFGVFWLLVAILVAQKRNAEEVSDAAVPSRTSTRLGILTGLFLIGIVYLTVVLLPPLRADRLFKRMLTGNGQYRKLRQLAIDADTLSPNAAYKIARMFIQPFENKHVINTYPDWLQKASHYAQIAADRNPESFKPWRLQGQINLLLTEQTEGEQKKTYLKTAFDAYQEAVNRYSGSDKLHFDLATVAEKLGRNDIALNHYQAAVDIEDAYRTQFRIMYPERKTVISRLGNADYIEAKSRIETLSGQ
ncbi:MAG: O-antigen ligase family protein [Planctomycetota bacterium]|jgi:O-antigen ligase